MAKITKKYSFTHGILSKENGRYILTEVSKDDSVDYDLSAIMDEMVNVEGLSFSLGADDEVPCLDH